DRRVRPTATPGWTAPRGSSGSALFVDAVSDFRDSERYEWLVAGRCVRGAELYADPARFDPRLTERPYSRAQVVPVLERVTNDGPRIRFEGRRRRLPGNLNHIFNACLQDHVVGAEHPNVVPADRPGFWARDLQVVSFGGRHSVTPLRDLTVTCNRPEERQQQPSSHSLSVQRPGVQRRASARAKR